MLINAFTKIISLLIFLTSLILADNIYIIVSLLVWVLILYKLNNIKFINILKVIWSMKVLIIMYVVISVLSKTSYETIINVVINSVSTVLYTSLLVMTTKALELNKGLEKTLLPLKSILPIKEVSFILMMAFKFIPLVLKNTKRVLKSLASRGLDYKYANVKNKLFIIEGIIIPIFNISFRTTDNITEALEIKHFNIKEDRLSNKEDYMTKKDYIYLISHMVILLIIIIWRIYEIFINHRL